MSDGDALRRRIQQRRDCIVAGGGQGREERETVIVSRLLGKDFTEKVVFG